MGRISGTALLLLPLSLQFASAGVDAAGTGEAPGTTTTVVQPHAACPDDGTSERGIHGASNQAQVRSSKAAKKAARSVQESETRSDRLSNRKILRVLLVKGANQGDPQDASAKKKTSLMAASSDTESVPLQRATPTSACPGKTPLWKKCAFCPCGQAVERGIVQLYQKSCSGGLLVPALSKVVDLHSAGATVLRRRIILLQDFSDAVMGLFLVYRILGGTDMNMIRRDHHAACRLLEEARITHAALWNEEAEHTLVYGQKVCEFLRNRQLPGAVKPFPTVSQLTKLRRVDRLMAASNQVDATINTHVMSAYALQMTADYGSLEQKLEFLKRINSAVHILASIRDRMRDVWYLYAEFLYVWLSVKQASIRGEVEEEKQARIQTTKL